MRPVPWSQDDDRWGKIDSVRQARCVYASLCLLCGETVTAGKVIWNVSYSFTGPAGYDKHPPPPKVYSEDLDHSESHVVDSGPLHDRCAKMTQAHCKSIKERLAGGYYVFVDYEYQNPHPCQMLDYRLNR